jgi:hypothetical protein
MMKVISKTLLAFIVFIFVCKTASCENICAFDPPNCMNSPSRWCVWDDVNSVEIQKCAVGCEEVPGPVGGAFCTYGPFKCANYMGLGDYSCCNGDNPWVRCAVAYWDAHPDLSDCILECATACGRRTSLAADCENCTITGICSCPRYPPGSNMQQACEHTCFGVCSSNEQICEIIMLLRYGAMFAGVIMWILHGFKWMVSEDVEGRQDAKRGMVYVLIGLTFILVAAELVQLMFFNTIICNPPFWWWYTP